MSSGRLVKRRIPGEMWGRRPGMRAKRRNTAGTGYWAHVLRERGVEVRAFDMASWETKFNPRERTEQGAKLLHSARFTEVEEGLFSH